MMLSRVHPCFLALLLVSLLASAPLAGCSTNEASQQRDAPLAVEALVAPDLLALDLQDGASESDELQRIHKAVQQELSLPRVVPLKHDFAINYASTNCGAQILEAGPQTKHASAMLTAQSDSYMLHPCRAPMTLTVQLCDAVLVQRIVLANFELFSSTFGAIRVYVSQSFPTNSWHYLETLNVKDVRQPQQFDIAVPLMFSKYVRLEADPLPSGEFYCPISSLAIFGMSMIEELNAFQQQQEPSTHVPSLPDTPAPTAAPPSPRLPGLRAVADALVSIFKRPSPPPPPSEGSLASEISAAAGASTTKDTSGPSAPPLSLSRNPSPAIDTPATAAAEAEGTPPTTTDQAGTGLQGTGPTAQGLTAQDLTAPSVKPSQTADNSATTAGATHSTADRSPTSANDDFSTAGASSVNASTLPSPKGASDLESTQTSGQSGHGPGQQQMPHQTSASPTATPATRSERTVRPLPAPPLAVATAESEPTIMLASRLATDDCLVGNTTCVCLSPRVVLAGLAGLPPVCPPENASRATHAPSIATPPAPFLSMGADPASIPTFAVHGTRIPLALSNAAATATEHAADESRAGGQAGLVGAAKSAAGSDGVVDTASAKDAGGVSAMEGGLADGNATTHMTNSTNAPSSNANISSTTNASSATAVTSIAHAQTDNAPHAAKDAAASVSANASSEGQPTRSEHAAEAASAATNATSAHTNTTNATATSVNTLNNSTNSTAQGLPTKTGPASNTNASKLSRGDEGGHRLGHQESIFVQLLSRIQVIERELNASETLLGRLSLAYSRLNVSQSVLMANLSSGLTLLNDELAEFSNRSLSIIRSHTELLRAVLDVSDMIVLYLQQTANAHSTMRDSLALQNHLIVACMLLLALLAVGVGYVITLLLRMQPMQRIPGSVLSTSASTSQSAISTPSPSRRSPRQR